MSGARGGALASLLRGALWSACIPYGWAMRLRNCLYDRGWKSATRVPVPVVSIGNLTMGGTGKTPCVEYVARRYKHWGLRVVLLSRGYKSTRGRNDEALLLDQNLPDVPHLQGADRVALANKAIRERGADVLVLDDGFQHRRLARDLDVVLVDATAPWGHGHLCPRGLLREASDGLARAHMVMLTRSDQVSGPARRAVLEEVRRLAPQAGIAETTHRPLDLIDAEGTSVGLEELHARPVAAFCGIGNPGAFKHALLERGIQLVDFRSYPDHHGYPPPERAELARWLAGQPADCLALTTQKDLVKLACLQLGGRDLRALRIGIHFESGQEQFDDTLAAILSVNHVQR